MCDGTGLLLHKYKDGGNQWIYHYILHRYRHEIGLNALRDVSLKKLMNVQLDGALFFVRGVPH
ncbi:putative integrase DNA protein [Bartonella tribocorum]|uniref:Integrase protein n=1 Tax=Bartonella tribocorum (strain DSM 28219 / CCUG 45778 / CIP 105476 / IBS 506) TaxID=382640 RepID=A9IVT1_BART1|nr:putative integrase protein [Bartonella tribocorum CIP 105476]